MSLFQTSVIKKYENELDSTQINQKYQELQDYFGKPDIQQHIRSVNEEQFQVHFFRELFVKILGYDLNDKPDYSLAVEFKNVNDSKKADGAILKDGKAIGVVELKSTQTTDLDKVEAQAFGYKNHHPECVYVVTSNFEKLRFYVRNAVDYIEFDLFNLTSGDFKLMWLCLEKDNLLSHVPEAMKKASVLQEEDVTKKLYADYAKFREALFNNMVKNNPETDKLSLFKKTQKLLDRFLFIFFAEDRLLVPPNSITQIIDKWEDDVAFGDDKPLYDLFRQYFRVLNHGRPQRGKRPAIFAYNGGLFKPDELLDSVKIDNEVLKEHALKLTAYDFETDVDVNILGHIFEHSIGEIENVQAEIKGETQDKTKSRRKKEGVFYTPKYITQYIVENTVGKLCEEKRSELGIVDEEYTKGRKHRKKATLKELIDKLDAYRNWLLQLTILDPACGSGAFLNQALDFLIKEHGKIDELRATLLDESLMLSDITSDILENNIFGVDINDESVEIAKLSLWLRTAAKGRKLNTLSDNIKCGNSLIDDPEVAGDKAFKWEDEFPEVFKNGGFDVVIGNPPYLRVQGLRDNFEKETKLYETLYKSATGRFDIYVLFIEKAFSLIKKSGNVSFILPHKFMVSDFGEGIRQFLVENKAVEKIVHFGAEMVFADASTYTCILCLSKNNKLINYKHVKPSEVLVKIQFGQVDYSSLNKNKWELKSQTENKLFEKLKKQPQSVKTVFQNISQGVVSVGDDIFLMKGEIIGDKFIGFSDKIGEVITIEAETVKPLLKGENVKKYAPLKNTYFCLYPHFEKDGKTVPFEEEYFKKKYPLAYNYILPYKEELIAKKIRYKTNPRAWYSLHRSREISLFEQEKIITPEISLGTNMTIDENNLYHNTKCYTLAKRNDVEEDNKFWLAILNSKLLWYFLSSTGYVLRGGFFTFKTKYLEPFPLPRLNNVEKQNPIIEKVNLIISKTADFQNTIFHFIQLLQNKFEIEKTTTKLQNWHELEFKAFLKELKKQKVKLSLSEESEWMQYFSEQKQKAQNLQQQIDQTDREIDQMVYELYGLTNEEIKIVEESVG